MRAGITLMLVVAAALGAAAPAHAQRQSLSDRVGALEQQMYNNTANQDLLNQLGALRQQVQGLQSTIEQLQHENAQLKQSNQDAFLDLDERINRLEGGAAPANPAAPVPDIQLPGTPPAQVTNYRWPRTHYEEAAVLAGFARPQWHEPQLDAEDVARHHPGYWNDYVHNCMSVNLLCQR